MSDYKCGKCSIRQAVHSYAYCYHDGQPDIIYHRCDVCKPSYSEGLNYTDGYKERPYLMQSNWIEPVEFRESMSYRGNRTVVRDVARHHNTMCSRCRLDVFDASIKWVKDEEVCPNCINAKTIQCDYCVADVYAVYGPPGARYCSACDWKYRDGLEFKVDNLTMNR